MTVNTEATGTGVALAPLLHESMVSWDVLDRRYRPLLKLVDMVLGVVPTCDRYLEIWPTGFRTYNVLVPNLLNLPVPVLGVGGPPPAALGLAMYVASRTAGCSYCSAHTCSFAMRRGAAPETLAGALLPDRASFTRGELATIAVAQSLAVVPSSMTAAARDELESVYGRRGAEWIAMGAVLMGFLNTFMDVIGVELEQAVVDEVAETLGSGWSAGKTGALLDASALPLPAPGADGLLTKAKLLPLLPGVIRFDRRAQRGVPAGPDECAAFLLRETGHDFPVLAHLHSRRVRRSIATVLGDNLDPARSCIGIRTKVLAGAAFAAAVRDDRLASDIEALAARADLGAHQLEGAVAFGAGDDACLPDQDAAVAAALMLARAGSYSPARIDAAVVSACRNGSLTPASIVELVTWLSVLALLRRLTSYALPRT